MTRIVVVGGGIAGLSLAHALLTRGARERGIEVQVLEKSERAGGNLRSEMVDGYLCEWGPNGFLDSAPETLGLVRELGLQDRLLPSDDRARRRYVLRKGRLHALPGGPAAFLRSGLLSWRGKLRLALEPFARPRPKEDETIHAFATRRIGGEAADVLIDAMVSGVFAGDARALSLHACFPKMWQLETDHGSLLRALFVRRREGRHGKGDAMGSPGGRLMSFRTGIEELVHGLRRALAGALHTRSAVSTVEASPDGRFRLPVANSPLLTADAVVLAGGARESARVVEGVDGELAGLLRAIPHAPLAVVCLGYEEARLPRPLDGFGFLVPRGEGPRILGALWDSSIYPGRAPAGRVLLRAMIGGAHDPEALALDDAALVSAVRRDLLTTMRLDLDPVFRKVVRHPVGIPQYTVGHWERLARIEERLARRPRLYVAGNAFRGVAINSCAAEAGPLARRILSDLAALRPLAPAALA